MTFNEPCLAAPLLPPSVESSDDNVFEAMKKLRFPVLATLKKDGIRALRLNGTLLSRRLKQIPNKNICAKALVMPGGYDVELWNKQLPYYEIESIVMSQEHLRWNEIEFHVIDWFLPNKCYADRCNEIMNNMHNLPSYVKFSPPVQCNNAEQLITFEKMCIEEAGEGICFRTANSPYKQGRSSLKEQWLVKLSRWSYEEAEIIGFIEQMSNVNRANVNALGRTERSMSQSGMRGKNTLGALIVRNDLQQVFPIGTGVGLTDRFRREIWHNQDKFKGRWIRYKTKAHGTKVLPRQPVFCGFRDRKVD